MSVQGTILVVDGVSTNRIMLKVQLTAAWYHVVQAEKLSGLKPLIRRTRPDLILAAQALPGGSAADVKALIQNDPFLCDIPVVAITSQNDRAARMRALSDGLDDVLAYPFKDTLLLAHVRSLLRIRAEREELRIRDDSHTIGFAEPTAAFAAPPEPGHVALLSQTPRTGALWSNALAKTSSYQLTSYALPNLQGVLSNPPPDAIVVELGSNPSADSVLADLRSRQATRHTVIVGIIEGNSPDLAAQALDRGADAICTGGFNAQEVSLRLAAHIARKSQDDRLRASVRTCISDAFTDPLTGLHNRRYALQALDKMALDARQKQQSFAIMLADLDHFKSINDSFGHAAGDWVLTETARRLRDALKHAGFVARVGGEEFIIGLPDVSEGQAVHLAGVIRNGICAAPFQLPDQSQDTPVTISIGLKICAPSDSALDKRSDSVGSLMKAADAALYAAKRAGRNQVSVRRSAA